MFNVFPKMPACVWKKEKGKMNRKREKMKENKKILKTDIKHIEDKNRNTHESFSNRSEAVNRNFPKSLQEATMLCLPIS